MGKNPEPKVDKVRAKAGQRRRMHDGLEKEVKEKIRMKRQRSQERKEKYTAGVIR